MRPQTKERIGTGSYKTVYKGFDHDTGCEVAWNQIKFEKLKQNEVGRLADEIRILSSLNHSNIINFFDFYIDEEKKRIIFITELMTSGTLRQFVLRSRQSAKLKVIKRWCVQILRGLIYLHSQNIIHRDLKCDNIFINGSAGEALRTPSCERRNSINSKFLLSLSVAGENWGPRAIHRHDQNARRECNRDT